MKTKQLKLKKGKKIRVDGELCTILDIKGDNILLSSKSGISAVSKKDL